MHCLGCGSDNLQVIYTRKNDKTNEISRRRTCNDCGLRFTTIEYIKPRNNKQNDRVFATRELIINHAIQQMKDVITSMGG